MWYFVGVLHALLSTGNLLVKPEVVVDHRNALETLLELHRQYCPTVSLCTVNASTSVEVDLNENRESCCYACSCDSSCHTQRNCCPDVQLLVDQTVVESLDLRIDAKENATDTEAHLNISMNSSNSQVSTTSVNAVCVEQQVARKFHRFHHGKAYFMIWSCPQNVDSKSTSYQMCRNFEELSQGMSIDYVPVTSHLSNITYRNKHCLACNEGVDATYRRWKPILICGSFYPAELPPFHSFKDVIDYAKGSESINCNLLYLPPESIASSLLECIEAYITSCNITGNWRKYDPLIDVVCTTFHNPVDASIYNYNNKIVTTFKNLACYTCNAHEYNNLATKICPRAKLYTEVEYVSAEVYDGGSEFSFQMRRDPFNNKDSLKVRNSNGCEDGFFRDKYVNTCRKIHCPRDHFMYKTECIPIFSMLNGIKINVQVKTILHRKILPKHIMQFAYALKNAHEEYLQNRELSICDYSLWQERTEGGQHVFYYSVLLDSNTSFSQILEHLHDFGIRKEIFGRMLDEGGQIVQYSVQFAEGIKIHNWHSQVDTFVDQKYTLLLRDETIPFCGITVPVTATSYCDRVQLNRDEYQLEGHTLLMKKANRYIDEAYFDITTENMAYVCLKEYEEGNTSESRIASVTRDQFAKPEQFDTEFFLGCAGIAGVVVLIMLVPNMLIKAYRRLIRADAQRATTVEPQVNSRS